MGFRLAKDRFPGIERYVDTDRVDVVDVQEVRLYDPCMSKITVTFYVDPIKEMQAEAEEAKKKVEGPSQYDTVNRLIESMKKVEPRVVSVMLGPNEAGGEFQPPPEFKITEPRFSTKGTKTLHFKTTGASTVTLPGEAFPPGTVVKLEDNKWSIAEPGDGTFDDTPKENTDMAKPNEDIARHQVADHIAQHLESIYDPSRVWHDEDKVGPMGGVSDQVLAAIEIDGKITCVGINVYSDSRIEKVVKDRLEEQRQEAEADRQMREDLGFTQPEA